MAELPIDDLPLQVHSEPALDLPEKAFALCRQHAKERTEREQVEREATARCDERLRMERRRLAAVGAEAFHWRRTVASLEEPLRSAGLEADLQRLQLMLDRMDRTLRQHGVVVEALEGRLLEEVADTVEVLAPVPDDVATACVRETVEPLVSVDGEIITMAKIITSVPRTGAS